ncbi:NAD(P)-dependent oxidoreductase [Glaciihabitans sp. UYNi722]|uniref:NAD-dependent epimerase/dehydratase family protein n=1 Tax=Glaciihabitans sp. UYNi722 TaxID=3156344 RepID=UPI003392BD75
MIIAVTGASGFLGSQVASRLKDAGHEVRGLDRVAARDGSGIVVDLQDPDATRAALEGCEGVVHMAGYPRAGDHTGYDVFTTNTSITWSVVDGALAAGVSIIAYVSSISAIGYPFYVQPITPAYLPLDEGIVSVPQDSYGVSKVVGEQIITAAVLRSGGSLAAVSLRFPALHSPESFVNEMPATVESGKDVKLFWSYLDTRDAASSVAAVFERENVGHSIFFVAADDSFSLIETSELVSTHFPDVPLTRDLPEFVSLLSNAAAKDYLSFTPQYSWRSYGSPSSESGVN